MSDAYSALACGATLDQLSSPGGLGGGFGGDGGLSPLTVGALGAGAAGVGLMMAQGPAKLPLQFQYAEGQVPGMLQQSGQLYSQGQGLVNQAKEAYGMAQRGELTPEQAAQLGLTRQSLENTARQTYASMGRDPGKDTSFISTEQNIDAATTAMAQQYIQSTIALAGSQMAAGGGLIGRSQAEQNAANQVMIAAGQAQIQLDTNYSNQMAAMFKAIGTVAGAVGGFMVGGPVGAMAGASALGAAGGAIGSKV